MNWCDLLGCVYWGLYVSLIFLFVTSDNEAARAKMMGHAVGDLMASFLSEGSGFSDAAQPSADAPLRRLVGAVVDTLVGRIAPPAEQGNRALRSGSTAALEPGAGAGVGAGTGVRDSLSSIPNKSTDEN